MVAARILLKQGRGRIHTTLDFFKEIIWSLKTATGRWGRQRLSRGESTTACLTYSKKGSILGTRVASVRILRRKLPMARSSKRCVWKGLLFDGARGCLRRESIMCHLILASSSKRRRSLHVHCLSGSIHVN